MSAARRLSLVTMLMTCIVLAFTASAARAQMGWEPTPEAPAPAPSSSLPPAGVSLASSLEPLGLGMPLQFGASLAAYRWFETAIGQLGNRQMPALNLAAQRAARSAWWRRRA